LVYVYEKCNNMIYFEGNTVANGNHGVTEVGATMHWGPDAGHNKYSLTHGVLYVNRFSIH
jgi:hypothetical protein